MRKNIESLLFKSGLSGYRISKDSGVPQSAVNRFMTKEANLDNIPLLNAEKLNKYYKEEVEMDMNIKAIAKEVENLERYLDDSQDPDYHEVEYIDGASDHYIVHRVEGVDEDVELLFEEQDFIKEIRTEIYGGEKTEEDLISVLEELNDLEDQYDYDKVVGYMVNRGQIEWL